MQNVRWENVYFINGTAYAGKSTMVKMLAEKHGGIACEENYHDQLSAGLDREQFPCLTYTRDLENWSDFIRRTPDEYEAWSDGCTQECTVLELKLLEGLSSRGKKVFCGYQHPCSRTAGDLGQQTRADYAGRPRDLRKPLFPAPR